METIRTPNKVISRGNHCIILLKNNKCEIIDYSIIDKNDYGVIKNYKWHKNSSGYCVSTKDKKEIRLHRLILNNPNKLVDHIDRNKLNNKKNNLRTACYSLNGYNRKKMITNRSGITGVFYNKRKNTWIARITVNNKIIQLKETVNKNIAILERKKAEIKYFGFNIY